MGRTTWSRRSRPPSTISRLAALLPLIRSGSNPLSAEMPLLITIPTNAAAPKSILMRPDPPAVVPSDDGVPIVHFAAPIFQ